jgi:hypothetical protein
VIVVGRFAFKFARNARGRASNLYTGRPRCFGRNTATLRASMACRPREALALLLALGRASLLTAFLAGFRRAIAKVGAIHDLETLYSASSPNDERPLWRHCRQCDQRQQ